MKRASLILLVLLFCSAGFAVGIENSLQIQSVQARVIIKGEGRIGGTLGGTPAEIEILSFSETPEQQILSLDERLEINGKQVAPKNRIDNFGNAYALFEISETGEFTYEIVAVIETNALFPRLQDYNLSEEITLFMEYIEPTENIESNHEAVRTLALNRFPSQSWLETIVEVTEWTNETLEYDLTYYPETYPATTVLDTKKGVCDEYAVLSASILRARGIPVRVVNGISFNSREEGGWNNHAWLEAFNPNAGWIPLDPTFGEAGTVDGTHIVRGYSPDPSQSSVSKATVLESASVDIDETTLEVEVLSFKNFEQVFSLEADNVVVPANQWHQIETKARNNLNGKAISWFSLILPESFAVQDNRRLLVFEEGEEKQLVWQIRVEKNLGENEQLVGIYRAAAIGTDLKRELKVLPGEKFDEEAILNVADLVPTMDGSTLVVEITLENLGSKDAAANISLDSFSQDFVVGAFESRVVTVSVTNAKDREYLVSVSGPGLQFEKVVTVHEGIPSLAPDQPQTRAEPDSILGGIPSAVFTIEAAIIAGILIGIVAIALLLKELLSK